MTAGLLKARSDSHLYRSDWDQAITDYSRAIGLSPEFADAFLNRGAPYTSPPRQ